MNLRSSIFFSLFEKYTGFAIQFFSNIILARLLTPTEIGLYSVCAALLAVLYAVRDFGISSFLIQDRELTVDKIRTAFGMMIILSWPIAAIIWVTRDLIANIYDNPEIITIIGILTINFVILPFGQPARALLTREMRFQVLTAIDVASAAINAATAVILSWLDYGAVSLAYASVAGTTTAIALTLYFKPSHFRILPALTHWREMVEFGSFSTAASIVSSVGGNATEVILGKTLDLASVGLFSRATGLVNLFQTQLPAAFARVAFPSFAQTLRDGSRLEQPYLSALAYLTGALWPAYAFLAVAAEPIIIVLFGDQWLAAASIARILCIGGALNTVIFLVFSVYSAHGIVRRRLAAESVVQSSRIVLILVAAPFGLTAVAGAHVLSSFIAGIIFYGAIKDLLHISFHAVLQRVWRSAAVALCTVSAVSLAWAWSGGPETSAGSKFIMAVLSAGIGWCGGLWLTGHVLKDEISRAVGLVWRATLRI